MKSQKLAYAFALVAVLATASTVNADQYWGGGDNTWSLSPTNKDWDSNNDPWMTNAQNAVFNSTPGMVTVDDSAGNVGAQQLYFYGNGAAWTLKGGAVALARNQYGDPVVFNDNQGGVTTITSKLVIDTSANTDRYNMFDGTGGTGGNLVIGSVSFIGAQVANTPANRSLIVGSNNNGAKITLAGTYTDSFSTGGPGMEVRLGEGGATQMNYYLTGNFAGMSNGIQIGEGNVNVGPSANLGTHAITIVNDTGVYGQNAALYGIQGATISNSTYLTAKYDFASGSTSRYGTAIQGVSDNSAVTFTGGVGMDSTSLILNAADGGRATFYTNGIGGAAPQGLTKTGNGTVVLATANSYNTFADGRDNANASQVAMDIKAGTLLITNTSGSAFGNGNGLYNQPGTDTTTVQVENGATLGGSGISTQKVVAVAGGSIIAPGDTTANHGTNTLSTLHLNGGLTTTGTNGLTMDFKLNGLNNDTVDFAGSMLTLNGIATINLSGTPTVDLTNYGVFYLMTDIGAGSTTNGADIAGLANSVGTDPTIVVNAPAGYIVESSGFIADSGDNGSSYYVQLAAAPAVPEPSTYGLMGLGLLALVAIRRFRRVNG